LRAAATAAAAASSAAAAATDGGLPEDLEFEDPYEDVIEEEEDDEEDDEDDDDMDEEEGDDEEGGGAGAGAGSSSSSSASAAAGKAKKGAAKKRAGAGAMDEDDDDGAGGRDVFRPGLDALGDGEALDFDPSAYVMYHALAPEWPCLSFDVMPDRLGAGRTKFPLSLTAVAGTQADAAGANQLLVMRLSSLNKTGGRDNDSDDDDSDASDSDSEYDDDPVLEVQRIAHPSGTVNRVRVMPQGPHVVATWSEAGKVHLWDVRPQLALLDAAAGKGAAPPVPSGYGPAMTWGGHKCVASCCPRESAGVAP
jgi:ribosome assembly protein RRB1